jgi:hypothetical protein
MIVGKIVKGKRFLYVAIYLAPRNVGRVLKPWLKPFKYANQLHRICVLFIGMRFSKSLSSCFYDFIGSVKFEHATSIA